MSKLVHQEAEAAKAAVRNARHQGLEGIKKALKDLPDEKFRLEKEVRRCWRGVTTQWGDNRLEQFSTCAKQGKYNGAALEERPMLRSEGNSGVTQHVCNPACVMGGGRGAAHGQQAWL